MWSVLGPPFLAKLPCKGAVFCKTMDEYQNFPKQNTDAILDVSAMTRVEAYGVHMQHLPQGLHVVLVMERRWGEGSRSTQGAKYPLLKEQILNHNRDPGLMCWYSLIKEGLPLQPSPFHALRVVRKE